MEGRRNANIEVIIEPKNEAQIIQDFIKVVSVNMIPNMTDTVTP